MANDQGLSPEELRRSVIKIFTVKKKPNFYQPWDLGYQRTSGGSGCIIEGKRILTNAHVVANQVFVQVLKSGHTEKVTAHVEFVNHAADLALLSVVDDSFFDNTVPVEFGDLPKRRDKVAAYGFPVGGNHLSITEGVVSRIEVRRYSHSGRGLLAIQVDAAINPGNSGGPVFREGKMIGVAFQSYSRSAQVENTGYVVPMPLIHHFLEDVKTGTFGGIPSLGVHFQKLESSTLRAYLGMPPEESGVLITRVVYGSSADTILRPRDVILRLGGEPVANDATIAFQADDRVHFSHIVSTYQIGETMPVEVLRGGERLTFDVVLKPLSPLVAGPSHDKRPTYFIFAGLVFTPLTYNYMREWSDWDDVLPRFRHYFANETPSPERRNVVLVSQVLAHEINVGYHKLYNAVVERVNGEPITEMSDVLSALKKPSDEHVVIEIDHHSGSADKSAAAGTLVVIPRDGAAEATLEVLDRYGIAKDRSTDLE